MLHRIICVDDDPLCLFLAELTIKEANFANEILLAETASMGISLLNKLFSTEAQGLVAEDASTLIFLDINMPVMNGWDFLEVFEKDFQHLNGLVKVIILSSSIDTADMEKANRYRCVADYIIKPITVEALDKLKTAIAA